MKRILAAVLILVSVKTGVAQSRDSLFADSVFRAHTHRIELRSGALSGPGADLLLRATRNAQFVALSENHNVLEIPKLTTALFRALRDAHGFGYLALEHGPVAMERSVALARAQGVEGVLGFGRTIPHAFHFINDQELEMIGEVTRLSRATTDPVWGVDREYAATPVLEELVRLAPGRDARAAAQALLDSARPFDVVRKGEGDVVWLTTRADSGQMAALRRAFRAPAGSRAEFLLRDLELSRLSGALYRGDSESAPTNFDHNRVREEWMVDRFRTMYARAAAAGGAPPRVVLKSGHCHLTRGYSCGNVPTLGSYVSELARANGRESYHVWLSVINRPGVWWSLG
ncbi:MAG: hypothetical protein ICV87_12890, partial [Gemmatimonadetes bacterium]|nr:hypothetical protein [Gemmatimonadota bacterium]